MSEEPPLFPANDEPQKIVTSEKAVHLDEVAGMHNDAGNSLSPEVRSLADLALEESNISADSQREISNGLGELLGKFSMATAELKDLQGDVERGKEARRILEKISEILPAYTHYDQHAFQDTGFTVENDNPQYAIRKLQSHVVWLDSGSYLKKKDAIPYYIIGRRENGGNVADLILLQSKNLRARRDATTEIKLVKVKKDDLLLRDRIVEGQEVRDLTDAQRDKLVNSHTGDLELKADAPGNIHITDRSRFRFSSDEKDIREDGIQLTDSRKESEFNVTNKSMMDWVETAQVDKYLTKLIVDFGLEQEYLDILNGKDDKKDELEQAKQSIIEENKEQTEVSELASSQDYTDKALEALEEAEQTPTGNTESAALWAKANAYASFAVLAQAKERESKLIKSSEPD